MAEMNTVRPVRLAHLSDVHLPPVRGFWPPYCTIKRTLGWLNWQRKRRWIHTRAALDLIVADLEAEAPDHILISGDLINIGLPGEYRAARAWLESLGPPDRVSVVPGNHDIYVRGAASMTGVALWRDYMRNDAFGRSIDPLGPDATVFPYVRHLGPVALIGVCSAVPTAVGWANGTVGANQLERLAHILDRTKVDGLIRLVMIHHPPLPNQTPPSRALTDAEALADVLAGHGAELVVHGHNHVMSRASHAGIPVLGVASASAARSYRDEPPARYNLITITPGAGHQSAVKHTIAVETRGLIGSEISQPLVDSTDVFTIPRP